MAFDLLGWLRRRPNRRGTQQPGKSAVGTQGRVLAPSTVARALAAVSSFYQWAVATERFAGQNPLQRRRDLALARVPARHQPFTGAASRQLPTRREVRVSVPSRLPRPVNDADITALLESISTSRDLAIVLLISTEVCGPVRYWDCTSRTFRTRVDALPFASVTTTHAVPGRSPIERGSLTCSP